MSNCAILYHGDQCAAYMKLNVTTDGPQIKLTNADGIKYFPLSARKKAEAKYLSPEDALQYWLNLRVMPENRESLRDTMMALFAPTSKPQGEWDGGDARRLRHLAAALTYYQSGFDRFTLVPFDRWMLSGDEVQTKWPSYFVSRKDPEVIREESTLSHDGLEAFLCHKQDDLPLRDYTVNSSVVSGWFGAVSDTESLTLKQISGDMWPDLIERRYFRQYCTEHTDKEILQKRDLILEYADQFGFAGKRRLENEANLLTNFSEILEGEVTWLSEYMDLVPEGTEDYLLHLYGIMPGLMKGEYEGIADAFDAMRQLQDKARENGLIFTPSEFGLAIKKDGSPLKPVVIL